MQRKEKDNRPLRRLVVYSLKAVKTALFIEELKWINGQHYLNSR